jgi:hypothetical protein
MTRSISWHWKSKFARFIQDYGVESLAVELDVRPSAIYHKVDRGLPRPSVRPACFAHAQGLDGFAQTSAERIQHDLRLALKGDLSERGHLCRDEVPVVPPRKRKLPTKRFFENALHQLDELRGRSSVLEETLPNLLTWTKL